MAAELNSVKVAKDNLMAAVEFLTEYPVDLEKIHMIEEGIELSELSIDLNDSLKNNLLNTIAGNKMTRKQANDLLGVINIDTVIEDLKDSIKLLSKTEVFGSTRVSIKTMRTVRIQSEKIKQIAIRINVEALIAS